MPFEQYRPQQFRVLPTIVKNLLIINVLLFAATWVIESNGGVSLNDYLALHYFRSDYFRPYQYVTYMFMHADVMHIFFNMFALWMFGSVLENFWGPKRFLIFYMITGIGAALLYTIYQAYEYNQLQQSIQALAGHGTGADYYDLIVRFVGSPDTPEMQRNIEQYASAMAANSADAGESLLSVMANTPMLGASGAIFGILTAFGMLFPNTELYLMFIPIPIKAKYAVILYAGIELVAGIAHFKGDNVAHFAHIGGAIVGFILVKIWQRNRTNFY